MKTIFQQIDRYDSKTLFVEGQNFKIVLDKRISKGQTSMEEVAQKLSEMEVGHTYKIQVKKYMREQATPSFDFMSKWNNDIPMPLTIMTGKVEKMTRGMVYMSLHGEIEATTICMRCGKKLTNPISKLYGIGPECGSHFYINPYNLEEELQEHLAELKDQVQHITWSGWVIKSAITEWEEV